ncbi:MAG: hypothetical protein GEV28_27375 [Actinophytocola sp.]|uniref:hypothetical protein n=1 Tax=Actinophytocola sp. TaxID=1872138 RepID=UPI00132431C9|nr:hypothetical protein [Actinophytocola sp.]MPZ83911.1 hypothetical protein [Actinophytocola sp.]
MTDKRPGALINAVVAIFLQAALNAFAGVLLLWAAGEDVEHGRDPGNLVYLLGYVSIVIAVVLAVCGVLLVRRVEWARIPVAVIEVVGIISGLLTLAQGSPAGIANIALAVLVLVSLFRADTSRWLRPTPF